MHFSPFDALGLQYGKLGHGELRRAFKAAMLRCHPDKRQIFGIPPVRWPQPWQIEEAFTYLTKPKEEAALKAFELFPRTFFPSEDPVFGRRPLDEEVPDSIAQCSICLAFVHRNRLLAHVGREHKDVGDGEHLAEAEGLQSCRSCCLAMASADAYASHMAEQHKCPVCDASEGLLLDHLEAAHGLVRCGRCDASERLAAHVVVHHFIFGCPICGILTFADGMLNHMGQEHGFQACEGCERWEAGSEGFQQHYQDQHPPWCQVCKAFTRDMSPLGEHLIRFHGIQLCALCPTNEFFDPDHILTKHAMKPCDVCLVPYEESRLAAHLRFSHDWLVCDVCSSAEPDEGALRAHQQEHMGCEICQQPVDRERYQQHLEASHALYSCHLCGRGFAKEALPAHFNESHPPLRPCAVCQTPQAEKDMGAHLQQAHQWVTCALCSGLMSEVGQESVDGRSCQAGRRPTQGLDDTGGSSASTDMMSNGPYGRAIQAHNLPLCLLCCRLSTQLLSQLLQEKHQPQPAVPPQGNGSGFPPAPLGREAPDGSRGLDVPEAQPEDDHAGSTHLRRSREPVQREAEGSDGGVAERRTATAALPIRPSPARAWAHDGADPPADTRSAGACGTRVLSGGGRALRRATRLARTTATATATATAATMPPPPRAYAQPVSSSTPRRKKARANGDALREIQVELTSKDMRRRFVDMVNSDSDKMRLKPACLAAEGDGQETYQFVSQISLFVDTCDNAVGFAKVCYYSGLAKMARELDRTREQSARLRTDSAEYEKILDLKGLKRTKEAVTKLYNQVALGRKLVKLCGPHEGLLCFLALSDRGVSNGLKFTKDDLETFHSRLSHFKPRWDAGEKYTKCISDGTGWGGLQKYLSENTI